MRERAWARQQTESVWHIVRAVYEGPTCQCAARCDSECGCGAWSVPYTAKPVCGVESFALDDGAGRLPFDTTSAFGPPCPRCAALEGL